jgi:NhaA family Na+:H+ antiporter
MLDSGVHPTITGVLLAFAIPFRDGGEKTPSHILQHLLHKPVSFIILPLFALANTSITFSASWYAGLFHPLSLGIISGLAIGKPLGIFLFSFMAVSIGLAVLPSDLKWKNIVGAGMVAGIGFTMSIFITLLAFESSEIIDSSKIAILIASLLAGIGGFLWLRASLKTGKKKPDIIPGH